MEHLQSPREPVNLQNWLRVIPVPVHLLTSQGISERPNPALMSMLGYDSEQMNERQFQDALPDETRQELKAVLSSIQDPQQPPFGELSLTYLHRNGSPVSASWVRVGPLDEPTGSFFVMLANVSPPGQLTRAQIRARLTQVISHDLNNVFTISQSYIDLIHRQRPPPLQSKKYLDRAAHAIRRGISVNEILHIITANTTLPADECFLSEIIERLDSLIVRFLAPGPHWDISCESGLPSLRAHRRELTRFVLDFCIHAYVRWPRAEALSLDICRTRGEEDAILLRLLPTPQDEEALPVPFQAFLSQRENFERKDFPQEVAGILQGENISLEFSPQAMTALLPAYESFNHRA